MRSLHNRDNKNALAQHVTEAHNDQNLTLKVNVIRQRSTPLETRLSEVEAIDCLRPSLNQKYGKTW